MNAAIQAPALGGNSHADRASVCQIQEALGIALAYQRPEHTARGALVEKQPCRQVVEPHGSVSLEGFQGVALRYGDIVATDSVPVPKLIGAHQVGKRLMQGEAVSLQRIGLWCRAAGSI